MSARGQTLPSRDFCGTAALPLQPDIARRGWHGRKVPFASLTRCSKSAPVSAAIWVFAQPLNADDYEARFSHSGLQPKRSLLRLGDYCGAGVQRLRNGDADLTRGAEVDNQLEIGQQHDRQLIGIIAVENAAHVNASQFIGLQ
jgi:hypothetical protein